MLSCLSQQLGHKPDLAELPDHEYAAPRTLWPRVVYVHMCIHTCLGDTSSIGTQIAILQQYHAMRQAHLKWANGLTRDTSSYLDLVFIVLKEGAKDVSTSAAVELDHLQLWEHSCPSCHHPLELDQAVQVMLPTQAGLLL